MHVCGWMWKSVHRSPPLGVQGNPCVCVDVEAFVTPPTRGEEDAYLYVDVEKHSRLPLRVQERTHGCMRIRESVSGSPQRTKERAHECVWMWENINVSCLREGGGDAFVQIWRRLWLP